MHQLVVLIPAYKPTDSLVTLVQSLIESSEIYKVVLVDDGGGQVYDQIFKKLCELEKIDLFSHVVNLGKGRSIKSGLNYILAKYPNCTGVVTADADGQHLPKDIISVARATSEDSTYDIILGSRVFGSDVPLRSRLGNLVTSKIFKFLVGLNVRDTQTGLRGFNPQTLLRLLTINGERYEYETNMLLEAKSQNWKLKEIPISTVYIENNKSSHFNPITDSMKIYFLIFRFLSSSLLSSSFDFALFALFTQSSFPILNAMLLSRFISGWVNFYLNRNLVFKSHSSIYVALARYWSLVLAMGLLSSTIVTALGQFIPNVLTAKLLVECVLFIASFSIQKEFVFSRVKMKD